MTQEEILSGLHPQFRKKVEQWLATAATRGFFAELTSGKRTPQQQDALYALGRKKAGKIVTYARGTPIAQSMHVFSLACDYIPVINGIRTYHMPTVKELGKIAKECGLSWGGDWIGFRDYVHLEYTQGKPLSHFQKGGTLDPEEPVIIPSKESRIIALTKRLSKTVDETVRGMIERVILRLKSRT